MSFDKFTKENLDNFLKELAKEYKKLNGKFMPAEIILIGGAAVLLNYGFRDMTTDVDAIIQASSSMKDAINRVGDKFGLPNGWLNSDFTHTSSYTEKLIEFSVYYKSFYNVLTVRTISAEYLIAMKLKSGRTYKSDMSDVIGILEEHRKKGCPINKDLIDKAVVNLYGGWDTFTDDVKEFIEDMLSRSDYENVYFSVKEDEKISKKLLVEFESKYPETLKQTNVNEILKSLRGNKKKD